MIDRRLFTCAFALLALVNTSLSVHALSNRPRVKILVTTFDPYDGAETNGSQTVAAELLEAAGTRDFDIEVCNLPVEFDTAAKRARVCFERASPKPDLVVSLGQSRCGISLESRAHNLRDAGSEGPDARGQAPAAELISRTGPEHLPMTLPLGDMYCALPEIAKPTVRLSASPGHFVCNEVAYDFARYLGRRGVPFGFIHVPKSTGCENPESPTVTAEKLSLMLGAAARGLRARDCDCETKPQRARSELGKIASEACLAGVRKTLDERIRQYDMED